MGLAWVTLLGAFSRGAGDRLFSPGYLNQPIPGHQAARAEGSKTHPLFLLLQQISSRPLLKFLHEYTYFFFKQTDWLCSFYRTLAWIYLNMYCQGEGEKSYFGGEGEC